MTLLSYNAYPFNDIIWVEKYEFLCYTIKKATDDQLTI